MPALKADGLTSSYQDYMLLDDRVLDDWRMLKHAEITKANNDANRQAVKRR